MNEGDEQHGKLGGEDIWGIHFHHSGPLSLSQATEYLREKGLIVSGDKVQVLMDGTNGSGGHSGAHIAITKESVEADSETPIGWDTLIDQLRSDQFFNKN